MTYAGTANAVTGVAVNADPKKLDLTMTGTPPASAAVLLSYTKGTNPLQSAAGSVDDQLESFTGHRVLNLEEAVNTYRFDALAAFTAVFVRASTGTQDGTWVFDSNAGSSGSGGTGPGNNNPDNFVYAETSG